MRHLRSIFYALVLAPAVWVLAGVGFTHDLSSRGRELFAAESISGLLLLIFSGVLLAILAFAPISPAGPVLAGVVYLGITIWAFNAPEAYAGLWAPEVSKEGFDLSRPGYGLAALLAIPLLVTALSARRWARYEPPVLPIIGEIGLFRGKAKAPGIPMSIAETTVLRAGRPLTPDQTVAIPPTAAGSTTTADRTVAIPPTAAGTTTTADPTVAVSAPAAGENPAAPAVSGEAGVTTAAETAEKGEEKAGEKGADEETERLSRPSADPSPAESTPTLPAADATQVLPNTGAARPAPAAEATQVLPAAAAAESLPPSDATQVIPPTPQPGPAAARQSTVTPPGDAVEPIKLPLPDDATTLIPAQRRPPAIES